MARFTALRNADRNDLSVPRGAVPIGSRGQVIEGIAEMIHEVQVEATLPDGVTGVLAFAEDTPPQDDFD